MSGASRLAGSLLAAVLIALLLPPVSSAATYVFTPVADSRVSSASPGSNYGKALELRGEAEPLIHSYLRFDIQGLDAPVTSATLRLYPLQTNAGQMELRGVADSTWTEGGITYANAPPRGGVAATSGAFTAGSWASIDASALVAGNGLRSMALTTPSTASRRLSSREVSTQSPQLVVRTASPEYPLVAAGGDIACDPASSRFAGGAGTSSSCRQRATSDLMLGRPLSALLVLGDIQYEEGTLSAFQASYHPSWGRLNSIVRPVPGNHEYETPGAAGYFDYFNGPGVQNGPGGARGKGYYSFDVANWHIIALNSNCTEAGGCEEGSAQNEWLEADLAAHPSTCTLAYWHHPRFSSGPHGNSTSVRPFWDDLYAAGADVVLNGHDHLYERFARQDPAGNAARRPASASSRWARAARASMRPRRRSPTAACATATASGSSSSACAPTRTGGGSSRIPGARSPTAAATPARAPPGTRSPRPFPRALRRPRSRATRSGWVGSRAATTTASPGTACCATAPRWGHRRPPPTPTARSSRAARTSTG